MRNKPLFQNNLFEREFIEDLRRFLLPENLMYYYNMWNKKYDLLCPDLHYQQVIMSEYLDSIYEIFIQFIEDFQDSC